MECQDDGFLTSVTTCRYVRRRAESAIRNDNLQRSMHRHVHVLAMGNASDGVITILNSVEDSGAIRDDEASRRGDTALKAGAAFAVFLCTNILDSVIRAAACAALIECIAGGAHIDGMSVEPRLRCLCRLSLSGALAPRLANGALPLSKLNAALHTFAT